MKLLKKLWAETHASTSPIAMLLLVTITSIGGIVGLVTLRDQIVQEFVDVGIALNQLDHSVNYIILADPDGDGMNLIEICEGDYEDDTRGTLCGEPFTDPQGTAPGGLTFPDP